MFARFSANMKHNRILSIGGDTSMTGPAIYLHVNRTSSEPDRFLLYSGQSWNLASRVKNMKTLICENGIRPCIHFAMEAPESKAQFIILANVGTEEYLYRSFIQNILEICVFLLIFTFLKDDL